jgi:hypothetical protein
VDLSLVVAGLIAVTCVVVVALPFLRRPTRSAEPADAGLDARERRRVELAEERDRTLAALKELEFDHRTGKVSDEDYASLVGPLRRRAAETLRALDADPGRPNGSDPHPAGKEHEMGNVNVIEPPAVPEPTPVPSEPPQPIHVPEPTPVPSPAPQPTPVPEPVPDPSPPTPTE